MVIYLVNLEKGIYINEINYIEEFFRFWWQYLISALILLLGILFLTFLKSERVVLNKKVFFFEG